MGGLSIWHWMIVLMVVLLLFGSGKVSGLMGDFAKGIKSFKKNMAEDDASMEACAPPPPPPHPRPRPRRYHEHDRRPRAGRQPRLTASPSPLAGEGRGREATRPSLPEGPNVELSHPSVGSRSAGCCPLPPPSSPPI